MMTGIISQLETGYRWGYIHCDGFARDVWFHKSELLLADLKPEMIGRRVSFELERTERGANAVNVTLED